MNDIGTASTLQQLSTEDCYRLLGSQQIGRLGVTADRYPLIFPVNYAMDGDAVVIRTNAGVKLTAADHANVVFEVDDIDPIRRVGWSVLVRGLAEEITNEHRDDLIERIKATGVEPWAPGDRGHWLRILPHLVTGRVIVPGELPPAFESHGYM
jgi:nitroimidazol reductase NimA-like FMN-containing flavoprotein (pyridoxamine 5'-phosphate oxidase superfamily)